MMYVQSQDRILNRMKEEDRKTWLIAFFAALGQPVVWAIIFVDAAHRLDDFGYPFWGFFLWVVAHGEDTNSGAGDHQHGRSIGNHPLGIATK